MTPQVLSKKDMEAFQQTVKEYYQRSGRHDLPWRIPERDGGFNAYKMMVSELMLQQTQVGRVIPKYTEFLRNFPNVAVLAAAPLGDVLRVWSGLGYNRRAKFLHHTAQIITSEYGGKFPQESTALVKLPGIGVNTAGAILAYALNRPVVFIETNIRTVFLHHFYQTKTGVADREILALVADTLDHEQTREWYWALMDYGSFLKRTVGNLNRASRNYTKQSAFTGSRRAIRGKIIKLLTTAPASQQDLAAYINDERFNAVLADLLLEGLIQRSGQQVSL